VSVHAAASTQAAPSSAATAPPARRRGATDPERDSPCEPRPDENARAGAPARRTERAGSDVTKGNL
jgi:hypothetical protein